MSDDLSNPAPHDAPLLALITRDPSTMNDKELDEHLRRLREVRGSAPTKRAKLAPTEKTKAASIDLASHF